MPITTSLTQQLGLVHPLIQGGMQWVGVAELVAAVSNAGALGILTALTQPNPAALREEIKRTRAMLRPDVAKRCKLGPFGVNVTLLPSISPPDYPGYVQAALDEGVRIFETAGNNPGPVIKQIKDAGGFVIHKCTSVRHALSAQKLGVDMLSIDGFECAGHPGEDDVGGLVLMARAYEELKVPFVASGGIGNGQGLAAALALGAVGANMGTRFMCTKESTIHENIKRVIVDSDERATTHIMRSLRNTARMHKNKISIEVLELEKQGVKFEKIQPLVSGQRGKTVYTTGDPDAGVWTLGLVCGLIHDIPSCKDLCETMSADAEAHINRLASLTGGKSGSSSRQSHL